MFQPQRQRYTGGTTVNHAQTLGGSLEMSLPSVPSSPLEKSGLPGDRSALMKGQQGLTLSRKGLIGISATGVRSRAP